MSGIRIEERGSVIIAHWPERPTVAEVEAFFDDMQRLLQKRPRAVVLNALAVVATPSEVRETGSRRLKQMAPLLRSNCYGEATVLSSVLVRGALAAIHIVSRPGYPTKTFGRLVEAITWAEAQVQTEKKRGIA